MRGEDAGEERRGGGARVRARFAHWYGVKSARLASACAHRARTTSAFAAGSSSGDDAPAPDAPPAEEDDPRGLHLAYAQSMFTISGALNFPLVSSARSATAARSRDLGSWPSTASAHSTVLRCRGSALAHSVAARDASFSTSASLAGYRSRAVAQSAFDTLTALISPAFSSTSVISFANRASDISEDAV